jgi:site-specific recombinase XerC
VDLEFEGVPWVPGRPFPGESTREAPITVAPEAEPVTVAPEAESEWLRLREKLAEFYGGPGVRKEGKRLRQETIRQRIARLEPQQEDRRQPAGVPVGAGR